MSTAPTCIFCQIIEGKIPSHKIYEDKNYFAFLDIHPISAGHTLLVPKNHSPDFVHAEKKDLDGLLRIAAKIAPLILEKVHATGFNIGMNTGKDSGQEVFHTHLHIIPRKRGDGLKSWGMGVTGQASQEELAQLAAKIRENR